MNATALIAAATITLGVAATFQPAFADHKGTNVARELSGALYGGSATRICGKNRACYQTGREVGREVFDRSQRFSRWYADETGKIGRKLRKKYCKKYGCN